MKQLIKNIIGVLLLCCALGVKAQSPDLSVKVDAVKWRYVTTAVKKYVCCSWSMRFGGFTIPT